MLNYSLLDVSLLIAICSVFVIGTALALVWLRHIIAQVEHATAMLQLLQQNPRRMRGGRPTSWMGNVN